MPKNKINSLKFKSVLFVILALVCGAISFFLIFMSGNAYVNNIYLSESNTQKRTQECLDSFTEYVDSNKISSSDGAKIKQWCKNHKNVYISIYKNGVPFFETDGSYITTYTDEDSLYEEYYVYDVLYPVKFADGEYDISLIEYSESLLINAIIIVGVAVAVVLIILIIVWSNQLFIRKAISLSEKVKEVCYGNMEKDIYLKGNDELSDLGNDVNEMRKSIIRHYEKEQEALKANDELLTSISHDIRTPLTAIIGYSEMMTDPSCSDINEMHKYASICQSKSYQLKDMTDTLFKYFLVYGNAELDADKQKYEVVPLLEQLIGEYVIDMREKGYQIKTDDFNENCFIETDVKLLKRVFDNVFSNAEKYADKANEIYISIVRKFDENALHIYISNSTTKDKQTAESTKIGLKTSEKIMEILGGSFETTSNAKKFTVKVSMPLCLDK